MYIVDYWNDKCAEGISVFIALLQPLGREQRRRGLDYPLNDALEASGFGIVDRQDHGIATDLRSVWIAD